MHIFHIFANWLSSRGMNSLATSQKAGLAEADAIIKTCVHYGFCTNTCPTYVLLGDENESPRGRIDLIKEMLHSGTAPKKDTVKHLDNCLSCLSCMTTCAAKVDYVHLIDKARIHIEETYRRPLADRFLRSTLATVLPNTKMLSWALRLGGVARPFTRLLSGRLRAMLELLPAGDRAPAAPRQRQVFAAEGERKLRVVLHLGCVQQVVAQHINEAAIRLLTRHGVEVIALGGGACCGALTLHMGKERQAKSTAGQFVAEVMAETKKHAIDAVIITASGCGTTVKDYGGLFAADGEVAADAAKVARMARDISELLHDLKLPQPKENMAYKVAYHDACSMLHGQRVVAQPRAALKRVGFKVHDIAERHLCCGSAGTYNMLQPDIAGRLGERKAANVAGTGADILCAGNLGCLTQIGRYSDIPAVHTVELLDWATGGPRPWALRNRDLTPEITIAAPPESNTVRAVAAADSFW
jgi:glycolate oxidase iron-sulfur subunit